MNNNICEICQTENEPEYKYCKNCGQPLKQSETANQSDGYQSSDPSADKIHINDYDGVSAEEMSIFIGKNSDKILQKFEKMQFTNSKISWTWPAAILGFILGPMGAALWFFYRKMYKVAIIFTVIGAFLILTTGALSYAGVERLPESAVQSFLSGDFSEALDEITNINNNITLNQKILINIGSFLGDITDIISGLFAGLFGMYIYKKFCVNKIIQYRSYCPDSSFYKSGLSYVGGTSGGMLAVGIILMITIQSIVDFILVILKLIF